MPTPTPGAIQQIIDQLSSPLWWFSVVVVGILLAIVGGLIAPRLDRLVLGRISDKRRGRLAQLAEHRQRLGAALLKKPHLHQLIAHRITVLHIIESVALFLFLVLFGALLGAVYYLHNVDPTVLVRSHPDLAPIFNVVLVLLLAVLTMGFMSGASRTRATRTDLEQALAAALLREGAGTNLFALDEQRRAAGYLPYYFQTPPAAEPEADSPPVPLNRLRRSWRRRQSLRGLRGSRYLLLPEGSKSPLGGCFCLKVWGIVHGFLLTSTSPPAIRTGMPSGGRTSTGVRMQRRDPSELALREAGKRCRLSSCSTARCDSWQRKREALCRDEGAVQGCLRSNPGDDVHRPSTSEVEEMPAKAVTRLSQAGHHGRLPFTRTHCLQHTAVYRL